MLLAFLLASVTGGILLAGLAVPAVTAAGSISNASTDIFTDLPEELHIDEPSEMSTMYAADGSVMTNFFINQRIVVSSDEISDWVKLATIAIEDRRFEEHNGIDVQGLARALVSNTFNESRQGGSTLTMQYIKNVRLEEAVVNEDPQAQREATQQTYGRKLEEARLAIALENIYSKDEILTGYLNISQYGRNVWGVEAASQRYFGIPASDVSLPQAAVLAAIPQAPNRWDPTIDPSETRIRQHDVLDDMLEVGMITEEEYDEAASIPVEDLLDIQESPRNCGAAGNMAYFCEYVVASVLSSPEFGETIEERQALLMRGGLQIYTTIDPERQQAAVDSLTSTVPINDPSNIKIALSAVEPGSGRIVSMAQNTNFGDATDDDPSATEQNLNVDAAHRGGNGFQVGSTFKPFVLAQWLQNGNTLGDVVQGNRPLYPASDWNISCAPEYRTDWNPRNQEGVGGNRVSVLDATRRSVNLPFVEMASEMDLCDITDTAARMGLQSANGEPLTPQPSMVLGAIEVTPLDMAAAYATFANDGVYCSPVAIERVTDADGNDLPVPETQCERAIDPESAAGVNHALQQVNTRGATGAAAALPGRPSAGKTGTANRYTFAWYIGYTPQLSAAVMMGHQEGVIPMERVTVNGRWYNTIYGGLLPAPTWRAYMTRALDGAEVLNFATPQENRTIHGDRRPVPSVTGLDVTSASDVLEDAGFTIRVEAEPTYSSVPEGYIASQSPGGGSMQTSGQVITVTISQGPEPEPEPEPDDDDDDDDGSDDD